MISAGSSHKTANRGMVARGSGPHGRFGPARTRRYSIASSAQANSVGGTSMPGALAVCTSGFGTIHKPMGRQ